MAVNTNRAKREEHQTGVAARNNQRYWDRLDREEAARRRTPQEQIDRLDFILGKNEGAKRERAKLHAKIIAENAKLEKQRDEKAKALKAKKVKK